MQEIGRYYGENEREKARVVHPVTAIFGIMLMSMLMLLLPCMAGRVYAGSSYPTELYVGGSGNLVGTGITEYTASNGKKVSYDNDKHILTLDNFSTDEYHVYYNLNGDPAFASQAAIYCNGDLTINLEGHTNEFQNNSQAQFKYGIYVTSGNLTITGNGSLFLGHSGDAKVTGYIGIGIDNGSLYIGNENNAPHVTILDASSSVKNKDYSFGIATNILAMISNGTVDATACKGIKGKLIVRGGTVNATGSPSVDDSVGISDGSVSVGGGKLVAKGKMKAISEAKNGSVPSPIIKGGTSYDGTGATLENSYNAAWKYVELDATRFIIENMGGTYNGSPYAATTANIRNFSSYSNISSPVIKYKGRNGTDYNESNTAPTEAGDYTVTATASGISGSADFTISKRNISEANVSLSCKCQAKFYTVR